MSSVSQTLKFLSTVLKGSKYFTIRKSRGKLGQTKTDFVKSLLDNDAFIASVQNILAGHNIERIDDYPRKAEVINAIADKIKPMSAGKVSVRTLAKTPATIAPAGSSGVQKLPDISKAKEPTHMEPDQMAVDKNSKLTQTAVARTMSWLVKGEDEPKASLFARYPEQINKLQQKLIDKYYAMLKTPKYANIETAGVGGAGALSSVEVQKILNAIMKQYATQLELLGAEAGTEAAEGAALATLGEAGGAEIGILPIDGMGIQGLGNTPREVRAAHDILLDNWVQQQILETALPNLDDKLKAEAMEEEARQLREKEREAQIAQGKTEVIQTPKFASPDDIVQVSNTSTSVSTRPGQPGGGGGGSIEEQGEQQETKPKKKKDDKPRWPIWKKKKPKTKDDDTDTESDSEEEEEEEPDEKPPPDDVPDKKEEKHGVSELRPYFLVGGQNILRITDKQELDEIRNWGLFDFVPAVVNDTADNPLSQLQELQNKFRYSNTYRNPIPQRFQKAPRRLRKNIGFESVYKVGLPNHKFYDANYYNTNELHDQERYFISDNLDRVDRGHEHPDVISIPHNSRIRRTKSVLVDMSTKGL